jgi:hypothetical protein
MFCEMVGCRRNHIVYSTPSLTGDLNLRSVLRAISKNLTIEAVGYEFSSLRDFDAPNAPIRTSLCGNPVFCQIW